MLWLLLALAAASYFPLFPLVELEFYGLCRTPTMCRKRHLESSFLNAETVLVLFLYLLVIPGHCFLYRKI